MNLPLRLGTKTVYGKIAAVGVREGERYYMIVDAQGCVTLMPAIIIEAKNENQTIPPVA